MVPHNLGTALLSVLCLTASGLGQVGEAPPKPGPDDRYKADIIVVVAHPDDETLITGYLAKAIYDEHHRVAVIFGTRGNAGGNAVGYEQAAALAAVREIEGRRALATFGVSNVWFLGGTDTPGQDVLRSLETWHHGEALEQTVRFMRLTRPEVVLTWLPAYVAGENHGDHQAAGVIATEAFDLAGNPTAFPEQVAPPRNRTSVGNLTEGLTPWQPQKLYYFSDAFHMDFLEGKGPQYAATEISPTRREPYCQLIADERRFYLSQGEGGQKENDALARCDFRTLEEPLGMWFEKSRFVFGKSVVPSNVTGDIFEGVVAGPVPFPSVPGYRGESRQGLSIELGGPWAFYREFWKAHKIEHLARLLTPEVELGSELLHVPLLLHNDTDAVKKVVLSFELPSGWTESQGSALYPVSAHDTYPVQAVFAAPTNRQPDWVTVTCKATADDRLIGSVAIRVHLSPSGLPQ